MASGDISRVGQEERALDAKGRGDIYALRVASSLPVCVRSQNEPLPQAKGHFLWVNSSAFGGPWVLSPWLWGGQGPCSLDMPCSSTPSKWAIHHVAHRAGQNRPSHSSPQTRCHASLGTIAGTLITRVTD
ncbi:hypothetical protein KUCAC02_025294 [Chaenocephalus aceratus]|uniref:Uncharacterized protein n=1 Tax=Chaenocephalus aceratus TaxID=36190 RepID=A0ACB9VTC0_CHAAC|nr:hypothetical protein KUCAC02_025294 [Chaenocephalus aceratus]